MAGDMKALEEQLMSVRAAIKAIEEGAQEYRIGSRSVRRGELAALYEREQYLENQIASITYGTRAYARWPTR